MAQLIITINTCKGTNSLYNVWCDWERFTKNSVIKMANCVIQHTNTLQ